MFENLTFGPVAPIAAALLTGIITFIATYYWRNRKRVTFWVEQSEDLTFPLQNHDQKITFKIAGAEVENLNRAVITVKNTGNVSIRDFKFRLVIPGLHTMSVVKLQAPDPDLDKSVEIDGRHAGLENPAYNLTADFLNPKEQLRTPVYFNGKTDGVEVQCRMEELRVKVRRGQPVELRNLAFVDSKLSYMIIALVAIFLTSIATAIKVFMLSK